MGTGGLTFRPDRGPRPPNPPSVQLICRALVAQGIERWPPEPGAQVRILSRALLQQKSNVGHNRLVERISLGKMQNPVRGLLHGSAALVSVVAVIALIASANGPGFTSVAIIYGVALVGVFTTSTLYHCLPWSVVWKARFQRLDHTWIYALVAATFTALLVGTIDGPPMAIGIALIWGIGALGALKEYRPQTRNKVTLLAQITFGAALMAPLYLMLGDMEPRLFQLTVVGSIAYLIGMLMMIRHWPRLLPRIFSYHEVFHIIVIAAAITHFLAVRELISTV